MNLLSTLIVVILVLGLCFLTDRLFQKLFRSRRQHRSGNAVKSSKRYALVGVILLVLGLAGLLQGGTLLILGAIVAAMGLCLVVVYLSFGIYYDEDTFLITKFGKKSREYRFCDIQTQRLYLVAGGNMVVELSMADGSTVSLQAIMEGVYPFLDYAFAAWCRQKGIDPEGCAFHDPSQSCWFPSGEEEEAP